MERRNVIIDCDPGIDDSLALMLALASPELRVLGITTVCGNVPAELGAANALKVLRRMGRLDIPVYQGAEKPLAREYVSAQDTHGADGMGESWIEDVTEAEARPGAVDFILESLRMEERVSVLAIGPMTNVALALKKDREAFRRLDTLISMGGSYKSHGNCSPVAEYNYWCDPEAAEYVYRNLGAAVHMVGLDVTRKIVLTPNVLEYMKILNPDMGHFVEKLTRFYFDFHWKYERVIGCVINDPLAVAYFINPELCRSLEAYTEIETQGISAGQSVVDGMDFWHREPNSRVLTEVDSLGFMTMFLSRLCGGTEAEINRTLRQILVEQGGF